MRRKADFLAMEVLSVQLHILQVFWPMDFWLVSRQQGEQIDIVATLGGVGPVAAGKLLPLAADNWPEQGFAQGFRHRPLSESELQTLGLDPAALRPRHVFKADLQECGAETSGMVAGFLAQELVPPFYPDAHVREIMLCLTAIAQTLSLQVELAAAEKLVLETQQDAQIDSLTKILNRAGWNKRLRAAANTDAEVAICLLDLDFLKFINDTQGHLAGDDLLKLTAQTIKAVLRNNDCVARLGGDEFAVMLQDVTTTDAGELKERLGLALRQADIKASIGVALKSEAGSLQKALQLADSRMYEEKRSKQRPVMDNALALTARQA